MSAAEIAVFDSTLPEAAADAATFVVLACERAKTWLTQALEQGDIESIVELKSQAEAIRVYTTQKQLGHDAELAAAEIVRRAERGIGLAIRQGQAEGAFRARGEGGGWPSNLPHGNAGRKKSPTEFATPHELEVAYSLADDVTDQQFDAAIDSARSTGNLSRANVVRNLKASDDDPMAKLEKATLDRSRAAVYGRRVRIREMADSGHTSSQIARTLGVTEQSVKNMAKQIGVEFVADKLLGRAHRIDPNRVVETAAADLEAGMNSALMLMDGRYDDLDREHITGWIASLEKSRRTLNQLIKFLKETAGD